MPKKANIIFFTFLFLVYSSQSVRAQDFSHELYNSSQYEHYNPKGDPFNSKDHYFFIQKMNDKNQINSLEKRNIYTHQLDSIDAFNKPLAQLELISKASYIYDDDNLREVTISYRKNDSLNVFKPFSYSAYTYSKEGLLKLQTYNLGNGESNNWNESNAQLIRTYEYNDDNQLTLFQVQDIQDIQLNLITSENHYNYDSSGNLSSVFWYQRNSNDDTLSLSKQAFYKHNEIDQLEEIVRWRLHFERGWERDDSTIVLYNKDALIQSTFFYNWIPELGYLPVQLLIYRYNDDLSINEVVNYYSYDRNKNEWRNPEIDFYHYHEYGSLNNVITYDSLDLPFFKEKKFSVIYNHDPNINRENVRFYKERANDFDANAYHHLENHMLLEIDEYTGGAPMNPLRLSLNKKLYYSEISTNTTEEQLNNQLEVIISPNPAIDNISIELKGHRGLFELMISDINGRIVYNQEIRSLDNISIVNLTKGVYIYSVNLNGYISTGKFVKVE
jgi:hypothetical protein